MSSIIGIEYCKVDSNGRFKLPVALKKQLVPTDDVRFVIRQSIYNKCLEIFTYSDFQTEVTILREKLNLYNPNAKRLFRKLTESNIIELDANDRFLIPMEQRSLTGIDKDIVIVSAANCMEIWDASTYKNIDNDGFDYVATAEELLGTGLLS
ncbi:MAG: mraZ [Bacteroidetes bacterium]|nr:mraZ [Bacteroidota bacterium]